MGLSTGGPRTCRLHGQSSIVRVHATDHHGGGGTAGHRRRANAPRPLPESIAVSSEALGIVEQKGGGGRGARATTQLLASPPSSCFPDAQVTSRSLAGKCPAAARQCAVASSRPLSGKPPPLASPQPGSRAAIFLLAILPCSLSARSRPLGTITRFHNLPSLPKKCGDLLVLPQS